MTYKRPFTAIVLAAGKGSRMQSGMHKVMHPLAGQAILDHLLSALDEIGPQRVVVVLGNGREQVEPLVTAHRGEVVIQAEQLGTAHAVLQTRPVLADFDGDILILYGDTPLIKAQTMVRMLARLHDRDAPAIVVAGFRPKDTQNYGRIIATNDGIIKKMVEHIDATEEERSVNLCNSGMMAIRAKDLFALLSRVTNDNAAGEYYLPDIVTLAAGDGSHSSVVEVDPWEMAGVNSRVELAYIEAEWQRRRRLEVMARGVTLVAPDTVWFAHDTRVGQDTVIEPNVVFGPGVMIGERVCIKAFSHIEGARIADDAEIGPYARLRLGSEIGEKAKIGNFVEVKKSRFGKGAKANHLSYIGDADVGEGANIGAGSITCNYDGFSKYQTVIGKRAFIGSNTALVAPVTIGDGAIIGAGSVIVRNVAGDALALARGSQVEKEGGAARFRGMIIAKKNTGK